MKQADTCLETGTTVHLLYFISYFSINCEKKDCHLLQEKNRQDTVYVC